MTPTAGLAAALSCSPDLATGKTPVPLIHGTRMTPAQAWDWGYRRALTSGDTRCARWPCPAVPR
ncbi:hypothetical protein [Streptomyces sp. UG1]|uniref:hypothetical protein n=1 Tax=Streptomyces sp. UG1 TaxID=3417652 RepID=UPI003CE78C43